MRAEDIENVKKETMKNDDMLGLMISGFLGALTNIFHGLYQNMIRSKRDLFIRFTVAVLAVCPAYLFCKYMDFPRDLSFIVGYISGALGDRVISEIYRREKRIFTYFLGSPDAGKQHDRNQPDNDKEA